MLVQDRDNALYEDLKIPTEKALSDAERVDMKFAYTVGKPVKSNAIVYVKDGLTVAIDSLTLGIGREQMSRVSSWRIDSFCAAQPPRIRVSNTDAPLARRKISKSTLQVNTERHHKILGFAGLGEFKGMRP